MKYLFVLQITADEKQSDAEEQSDSREPKPNSHKTESAKVNSENSSPTNSEASSSGRGTLRKQLCF
jgi:hypothetical protein